MRLLFSLMLCLSITKSIASNFILLRPTGNKIDGLVEMEIVEKSDPQYELFVKLIHCTSLKSILAIHDLAQVFLNRTEGRVIEPSYLALTNTEGGYARKGFCLSLNGDVVKKPESYYVDIHRSRLTDSRDGLMSIVELYSHELGHILYRQLSFKDSLEVSSNNVNVHFFSMITDYQIAFNEGFGEHMENIARLEEKNPKVLTRLTEDTTSVASKSRVAIARFRKDFLNPLRMGYYKISMLAWYQRFEDYKRFVYPIKNYSHFLNKGIQTSNNQDNLIYRNSGVQFQKGKKRNQIQALSNEGTISAFFTQFYLSEAKNIYHDREFYYPFFADSLIEDPSKVLAPLENLFAKYFFTLKNYVVFQKSDRAHLLDFVEGYIKSFPKEKEIVESVYEQAIGHKLPRQIPKQLWIMVKNVDHGFVAFDAFASLTIPVYTFDINAAEVEDFMMIPGFSIKDAEAIIDHRNSQGLFTDFASLYNIPTVSGSGKELLKNCYFDNAYLNSIEFNEGLTLSTLAVAPLISLVKYSLIYFTLIMLVYFLGLRKEPMSLPKRMGIALGYLLVWLILVLLGLVIAATVSPFYYILLGTLIVGIPVVLAESKNRRISLITISLMTVVVIYSII